MDKPNIKKLGTLITLGVFGALLLASIVMFIILGPLALVTKIVLFGTIAALIVMIVFNWELVVSFFKRSTNMTGFYKAIQFVIVLSVLVFLYIVSDFVHLKMDFTSARLYTLSEQTVETLHGITNELHVILFKPGVSSDSGLVNYQESLLRTYAEKNRNIKFEIIDPSVNPSIANEYNISDAGTVVFEYMGNRTKVKIDEIYEVDQMTGDMRFKGEIAFTSAIKGLLDSKAKNVYVLTGHGEINWADNTSYGYSAIFSAIQNERIKINGLNLLQLPVVPSDCGMLVIADPTAPLMPEEMDAVVNYLAQGGSVLALLEYTSDITVNEVLRSMSVFCMKSIVVDQENYYSQGGETWVIPNILPFSDITTPLLRSQLSLVLPSPVAIERLDSGQRPEGYVYYVNPMLQTSQYSFGETSDEQIRSGTLQQDEKDLVGPLTLAFAVKRLKVSIWTNDDSSVTTNRVESRLVVIGDTDFINNLNYIKYGNTDLLMNSINFLLKRDADITTRPRVSGSQPISLDSRSKRFLVVISAIVALAYLGVGIFIVMKRRRIVIEKKK